MSKKEEFYLTFSENWFSKDHLLISSTNQKLRVLEDPHRKWYRILLQWITFRWYKAPYQYKVEIYG